MALPDNSLHKSRLGALEQTGRKRQRINRAYTYFIKSMRTVLPLAALALVLIVILWKETDQTPLVISKEELTPASSHKNARTTLLKPEFESIDQNGNPVRITAKQAEQNPHNMDLIYLVQPTAHLVTKNLKDVHVTSIKGSYEQESSRLYLEQSVVITHEDGYEFHCEELRLDGKAKTTQSDKDVTVKGQNFILSAQGMSGSMDEGLLIFKGPAILIYEQP